MNPKSSVPQAASFVSQVLMPEVDSIERTGISISLMIASKLESPVNKATAWSAEAASAARNPASSSVSRNNARMEASA